MLNSCGHLDVLKHSCGSLYWTSSPPRKALKFKDEDTGSFSKDDFSQGAVNEVFLGLFH